MARPFTLAKRECGINSVDADAGLIGKTRSAGKPPNRISPDPERQVVRAEVALRLRAQSTNPLPSTNKFLAELQLVFS